jgi:glycosyltransferase involved in cell wall biosynthesis
MRLSVVTVCLNSAATIADTLASVEAQDTGDFEHIIVDGKSSDGTMNVVEAHRHQRLRWVSEPDHGLYDAMNKGFRMATGDYVIFLNSDDYFARPDALSQVIAKLRETEADCLFADTFFVQEGGRVLSGRKYSARGFRKWWLRVGVMPPHPSMFMRRELLEALGGFNTDFRIAADFDLIARAVLRAGCSWTTLPLAVTMFRLGGVSTSGLAANLVVGKELARSLSALGQPLSHLAVQLRYPMKALQLLPRSSAG